MAPLLVLLIIYDGRRNVSVSSRRSKGVFFARVLLPIFQLFLCVKCTGSKSFDHRATKYGQKRDESGSGKHTEAFDMLPLLSF